MHGVRRGPRPAGAATDDENRLAASRASLARRALALRSETPLSPQSLATVARALSSNPDEYSLWALRRTALLQSLPCAPSDAFGALWRADLDLSLAALRRHPKAYPAWQHRFWLLSDAALAAALPPPLRDAALTHEFAMSSHVLSLDGRNFHGWAHRMRVRSTAPGMPGASPGEELRFVTDKINDDFANYSAWHHRSALLPMVREGDEFVEEELEFVRNAFYTEPDVQSAWFYHRWLLAGAPARGKKAVVRESVCESELAACEELLDIEPEARWAIHAKADLLARLGRDDEAAQVYKKLIDIDPMRRGFYKFKLEKLGAS